MVAIPMLACGPYFSEVGIWMSLTVLLIVKPVTYFAFIQAFRYRVNRAVPMSFKQAAMLAALRTAMGMVLLALPAAVMYALNGSEVGAFAAWGLLTAERLAVWCVLGLIAKLAGRRLLGWTLSGATIDLAYDAAMLTSLAYDWLPHAIALTVLVVFIALLTKVGRRQSLKLSFAAHPFCVQCSYNLTGNLSGRCPECGTAVTQSITACPATVADAADAGAVVNN